MIQLFYFSQDQRTDKLKVKSMSIILLMNSTLYLGSVFLGQLQCLTINLTYENLLAIEYGKVQNLFGILWCVVLKI